MSNTLKVLIVEDSEDDAFLVIHELKKSGYDVISERVDTAEDLISTLDSTSWDIILSDYLMPHFTGAEALKLINERGLDIPFIIMSGKIGEETAVKMMKAGAVDYVTKDNLALLGPVIKRELHEAQMRREHKSTIEQLRESEENYRSIFDAVNDAIFIHDEDSGDILDVNIKMTQMFGCTREKARSLRIEDISAGQSPYTRIEAIQKIKDAVREPQRFEWRCRDSRGHLFWVEINMKNLKLGGKNRVVSVVRDISEYKLMEEELRAAAITDELTGLLNRRGFFNLAEQQLKVAARCKARVHLVYLDIDDFKNINDRLCHKAGDQALVDAAIILKETFRESDIVARIGGDEFVAMLMEPLDANIGHIVFDRMKGFIKEYNEQADLQYNLQFSVGTATNEPGLLCTVGDLLCRADRSMYKNKRLRKQKAHLSHVRTKKRREKHPGMP